MAFICTSSWCSLDLTYDLVVVTMCSKTLSVLFIGLCKVYKVVRCISFNFDSAKVCSPARFETCFSFDKNISLLELISLCTFV